MKYREWKKCYYIKYSNECFWYDEIESVGISKFIHWFRFHRKDVCEYYV